MGNCCVEGSRPATADAPWSPVTSCETAIQESCPSQAGSIGTETLLLDPSSILAPGYLLGLVKIKGDTSGMHAMLRQALGRKA